MIIERLRDSQSGIYRSSPFHLARRIIDTRLPLLRQMADGPRAQTENLNHLASFDLSSYTRSWEWLPFA